MKDDITQQHTGIMHLWLLLFLMR